MPSILDIDVDTFDTEAAIHKYGYSFDDSENVPKRRALLVMAVIVIDAGCSLLVGWSQRGVSQGIS